MSIREADVTKKQESIKENEPQYFQSGSKIKLVSGGIKREKLKGGCKMIVEGKIRLALQMDLF